MSKEHYVDLMTRFCHLVKLEGPEKIFEGNAIEINGVDFYLGYNQETDPEVVVVYADFGIPPQERLLDAYEALLEANMAIYGSNSPAFMLSPGKSVTLAYHYRLGHVSAEQLAKLLATLAEQAKEWRKNFFLEEGHSSQIKSHTRPGALSR